MKVLLLTLMCFTLGTTSYGKQYKKLTEIVKENVSNVTEALNESSDEEALLFQGDFELRRLFLRVQAKVGFDVEFGKIELIPEIELVFQKEKKQG